MFKREISQELRSLARQYPIVTVLGPRQSGKTTLVKAIFPRKPYLNLEDPDMRHLAALDPRGLLANYPNGAVLDEIQRVPQLLSYIQTIVDAKADKGLFILTGSHQLELNQAITQSLTGRTALLKLLPLTLHELKKAKFDLTLDEYLLSGAFPRIYNDTLNPTKAYRNYLQTYIERDVRSLINVKDLMLFQRFLKLCAGRVGQILNVHSLSNDLGVASHTVKNWLSVLEATYLVFQLQPYYENFGKRLIKSPKLYFADVGLACYLLDIYELSQVNRDPLRGALVENLVVLELIKTKFNKGLEPQLYYYRDNHQNEIDIIYKNANQLIPVEIKAGQTFHPEFLKNLQFFKNLVGARCSQSYLIYAGEHEQKINSCKIINFKNSAEIF